MPLAYPKTDSTRASVLRRLRRDAALQQARDAVWKRDAYHCRVCCRYVTKSHVGPIEHRGDVHHLVPQSRSRRLRAETSNLVLLCRPCHRDAQAYRLIIRGNADHGLRFERT